MERRYGWRFRVYPKGPCRYMGSSWALKQVYGNPFGPEVYTIYPHGPFGFRVQRFLLVGIGLLPRSQANGT